tara:strand:- start:86000 stop:86218 length:219 start_codon:yes stop_codon:yes gene_type:complete
MIYKGFQSKLYKIMGLSIMPFMETLRIRHENKILISLSEDCLLIPRSEGESDGQFDSGYLSGIFHFLYQLPE